MLLACEIFLWFVAYSLAGWIWEVILFCFTEKRFINRGFLNGPICPIYGFGALSFWYVLGVWWQLSNPIVLFLVGGLMACLLEYLASVVLEKMFNTRWWDYYKNKFNINGRVALIGFVAFGVFAWLTVRFVQPFVIGVTNMIPEYIIYSTTIIVAIVLGMDFIVTICQLCKLNIRLAELQVAMDQKISNSDRIQKLVSVTMPVLRRYAKAFPKMKSTKYDGAMKKAISQLHLKRKNKEEK